MNIQFEKQHQPPTWKAEKTKQNHFPLVSNNLPRGEKVIVLLRARIITSSNQSSYTLLKEHSK